MRSNVHAALAKEHVSGRPGARASTSASSACWTSILDRCRRGRSGRWLGELGYLVVREAQAGHDPWQVREEIAFEQLVGAAHSLERGAGEEQIVNVARGRVSRHEGVEVGACDGQQRCRAQNIVAASGQRGLHDEECRATAPGLSWQAVSTCPDENALAVRLESGDPALHAHLEECETCRSCVLAFSEALPAELELAAAADGPLHEGRFEQVKLLGRGSFSLVWEARELTTGQSVALKIVDDSFGAAAARRAVREARGLSEMACPYILKAREAFRTIDGRIAIVTDLLRGEDLGCTIEREGALGAGTVLGTPNYMSPEQISGDTDLGPATDVWSLGVLGIEAMSGESPMEGRSFGRIFRTVTSGAFPRLRDAVPDASPELAELIDAMLAPSANERPSAAVVAQRLGAASLANP